MEACNSMIQVSNDLLLAFGAGLALAFLLTLLIVGLWCRQKAARQLAVQEQAHAGQRAAAQLEMQALQLRIEQLQEREQELRTTARQWQDRYQAEQSQWSEKQLAQASEISRLTTALEQQQKRMEEQLKLMTDARAQLVQQFEHAASKIFDDKQQRFSHQSRETLEATLNPLKQQLSDFRKRVDEVYGQETADRNRLVGQISELQKQTRQISQDAINLTQALKGGSKAQGNWGEVVLERLLEQSGLQKGREYETQVSLVSEAGGRRNPDVIVRLPENKDIVIDAKVSLVDYERYCSEESEPARALHLKAHIQSLRNHINGLSFKDYENLPGLRTLDFVFIFVPVEAAFMLALQEEPGLFREAYDKHIILVSPTTLLATLRTVENIWRYEKQNRNAEKIATQAGALLDKFVMLVTAMDDVGKSIGRTQDAYDKVRAHLSTGRGNLIKRAEDIRKLGAKTKKQLKGDMLDRALDEADQLVLDERGLDEPLLDDSGADETLMAVDED